MTTVFQRISHAFGIPKKVVTPRDAVTRFNALSDGFLTSTYAPAIHKAHCLAFKIGEIAELTEKSGKDLAVAFERGKDLDGPLSDIQFAFNQYGKCFSELAEVADRLERHTKFYSDQLEGLKNNHE